jgi:hypothetical protein
MHRTFQYGSPERRSQFGHPERSRRHHEYLAMQAQRCAFDQSRGQPFSRADRPSLKRLRNLTI